MWKVASYRLPVASRAALAAGLGIVLAGCSGSADTPAPAPVVAVQVAAVTRAPLQDWIRASAVLYPLNEAIITPKISAPVSRFFVKRGDAVQAGEKLAELENRDLAAAAQEAAGQLETAEANYATATAGTIPADLEKARLDVAAAQASATNAQKIHASREKLYQQGAIPRRELDQSAVDQTNANNALAVAQQHLQALQAGGHAQALQAAQGDLKTAQAHAAAARAAAGYSVITSPISGVVTERPVYPGELATPSAPLMTIMDLSQIVARVPLPSPEAAQLQVGDAATLTGPADAVPLPARVTVVSPATDPGSTTVEVWVEAANPGLRLRPGTTVQVAMLARTIPQALTIPASALLTDASGATTVMVAGSDGKAHQKSVTTGVRTPDRVQITSGLAAGDRVVSEGAYGLPDQTQIKIAAAPPDDKNP